MNRKKETYDRYSVGERIRSKRLTLGLSQDELAERIDRATKYYSDIERGNCGMSVETMLAIANILDMSLDYLMYGTASEEELERMEQNDARINHLLSRCNEKQHDYVVRMLELFVASMEMEPEKQVENILSA